MYARLSGERVLPMGSMVFVLARPVGRYGLDGPHDGAACTFVLVYLHVRRHICTLIFGF